MQEHWTAGPERCSHLLRWVGTSVLVSSKLCEGALPTWFVWNLTNAEGFPNVGRTYPLQLPGEWILTARGRAGKAPRISSRPTTEIWLICVTATKQQPSHRLPLKCWSQVASTILPRNELGIFYPFSLST